MVNPAPPDLAPASSETTYAGSSPAGVHLRGREGLTVARLNPGLQVTSGSLAR